MYHFLLVPASAFRLGFEALNITSARPALSSSVVYNRSEFTLTPNHHPKVIFIKFLLFVYPSISRTICQSFRCSQYDGGAHSFVTADMSMDCVLDNRPAPRYQGMVIYANLALLVYSVGIPLALFFSLFKWRHKLNPPGFEDEGRAIKTRMKNDAMLADPMASFAIRYRPHRWWYEVYTLGRRFALTSAVLAFPTLASSTVYVVIVAMSTLLLDREWAAHIDGLHSAFNHVLNVQILIAPLYMLLLDARMIAGEYSVAISLLLLVLNLATAGAMSVTAALEFRKDVHKGEQLKTLNGQLMVDKREDKLKFVLAWTELIKAGSEGDEARLLETLRTLCQHSALFNGKQRTPMQGNTIKTVDELLLQAEDIAPKFHSVLLGIVEAGGGRYKEGPNKTRSRAIEKIEKDYNGNPRKLVDVVRASAIFTTFVQLALFVEVLLGEGCALLVVRAKDRFNYPLDSGYRDMLLNVKLEGSEHVGELQLHLQSIIDIKEAAHRTYALMRAVGWEDDEIDEEEEEEAEADQDQDQDQGEVNVIVEGEGMRTTNFDFDINPLHRGNTGDIEMASVTKESTHEHKREREHEHEPQRSSRSASHEWSDAVPKRRSTLFVANAITTPSAIATLAVGGAVEKGACFMKNGI